MLQVNDRKVCNFATRQNAEFLFGAAVEAARRVKAPALLANTPILPSTLWVWLSPLAPTRAVLSQPRLQQDRSDEIGHDCPESPEVFATSERARRSGSADHRSQ